MTRFSVIMPAFNAEQFIEKAIRSALSQEGIPLGELELLVINDGSKDNTSQIVVDLIREYGEALQLIELEKNRGVLSAAIAGLKRASGQYICLLDADDIWYPGKLSAVLTFLEQGHDLVLHGGDYIDKHGNCLGKLSERYPILVRDADIPDCIRTFNGGVPLGSCICFNRKKLNMDVLIQTYDKFKAAGLDRFVSHDTSILHSILCSKNIKATCTWEKLFGYRIHADNSTHVPDPANPEAIRRFFRHLQYCHRFGLEIYKLSGLYYEDRKIAVGFRKFEFYKKSLFKESNIFHLLREYIFVFRNKGFTTGHEKIKGLFYIFLHRLPPKAEHVFNLSITKLKAAAARPFKTTRPQT